MEPLYEKQEVTIVTPDDVLTSYLGEIEMAARACYRSEIGDDPTPFIRRLLERGHESPIEFSNLHAIFRTSRGITHEIVRHRLFSFCQESTRYVNYEKLGYVPIILPKWAEGEGIGFKAFKLSCAESVAAYAALVRNGYSPQEARDVLPNATATTLHVTGNFREWRHFFDLRMAKGAHPEMRELATMLWNELMLIEGMPVIFGKEN